MSNIIQCTRCILDQQDDPSIQFNDHGVCNYCLKYEEDYVKNALSPSEKAEELKRNIQQIKDSKKGAKYDAILGLSGGIDSSYLAMKAKDFGLNCLLVHFDNGWNSELAVMNIESISKYTGFDLHTYVVDWNEYKELQVAYIKSGVIDWEVPTDHGFYACLFNTAAKYKITSVLAGFNHQSEAILPSNWNWRKNDLANLKDIFKKYGKGQLKTFPQLSFWKKLYYDKVNKSIMFPLLEYMEYNVEDAKKEIIEKMKWRDYGGKHFESIFTRFYQGYILPQKFGVDKRKGHFSSLICSGQLTRQEALEMIKKPSYDSNLMEEDKIYFMKKLGFSVDEFNTIMLSKPVLHTDFATYEKNLYPYYFGVIQYWTKLKRLFKN